MPHNAAARRLKDAGRRSLILVVSAGLAVGVCIGAFQHLPFYVWVCLCILLSATGFYLVRRAIRVIEEHDEVARRHEAGLHKVVEFDRDALFLSWDRNGFICDYAGGAMREFGLTAQDRIGTHVGGMFEGIGPEAAAAYKLIYDSTVPAASYEKTWTNPLTGEDDIWHVQLFTNDHPHAGYGLVRRVTEERNRAAGLEAQNAELSALRHEANERTLKLAKIAEDRFYGYYADPNNAPVPHPESVRGRDATASQPGE